MRSATRGGRRVLGVANVDAEHLRWREQAVRWRSRRPRIATTTTLDTTPAVVSDVQVRRVEPRVHEGLVIEPTRF